MSDTEAFIERLTAENEDFRTLREEHHRYEEELAALKARGFLAPDQQWRVSELKKLKLIAKDRMEALLRHARAGDPRLSRAQTRPMSPSPGRSLLDPRAGGARPTSNRSPAKPAWSTSPPSRRPSARRRRAPPSG